MADFVVFQDDAFRAMELSEAINMVPNQWGLIGNLGVFTPKPIRGTKFAVEKKNGVLQIVQSSERGTSLPAAKRGKRNLLDLRTERFGLKSHMTAEDVDEIRAYGSVSELQAVSNEVADRQETLRGSLDITREYLRSGALQGIIKDADGSELYDLFDVFDVTREEVDFTLGTATTDINASAREVTRHIKTNLMGDVASKVVSLMHPDFTDKLMANEDFRDRYKFYQNANGGDPLRDDVSNGFEHGGIYWKEYLGEGSVPQEDGSSITVEFVPEGECMFFPLGTRQTFRDFNGSPDWMGAANMPGLEGYSRVLPDKQEDRFVDVEGMMQTMPICMRPGVLVRGHTSN
jgi:hypothetical protein